MAISGSSEYTPILWDRDHETPGVGGLGSASYDAYEKAYQITRSYVVTGAEIDTIIIDPVTGAEHEADDSFTIYHNHLTAQPVTMRLIGRSAARLGKETARVSMNYEGRRAGVVRVEPSFSDHTETIFFDLLGESIGAEGEGTNKYVPDRKVCVVENWCNPATVYAYLLQYCLPLIDVVNEAGWAPKCFPYIGPGSYAFGVASGFAQTQAWNAGAWLYRGPVPQFHRDGTATITHTFTNPTSAYSAQHLHGFYYTKPDEITITDPDTGTTAARPIKRPYGELQGRKIYSIAGELRDTTQDESDSNKRIPLFSDVFTQFSTPGLLLESDDDAPIWDELESEAT